MGIDSYGGWRGGIGQVEDACWWECVCRVSARATSRQLERPPAALTGHQARQACATPCTCTWRKSAVRYLRRQGGDGSIRAACKHTCVRRDPGRTRFGFPFSSLKSPRNWRKAVATSDDCPSLQLMSIAQRPHGYTQSSKARAKQRVRHYMLKRAHASLTMHSLVHSLSTRDGEKPERKSVPHIRTHTHIYAHISMAQSPSIGLCLHDNPQPKAPFRGALRSCRRETPHRPGPSACYYLSVPRQRVSHTGSTGMVTIRAQSLRPHAPHQCLAVWLSAS